MPFKIFLICVSLMLALGNAFLASHHTRTSSQRHTIAALSSTSDSDFMASLKNRMNQVMEKDTQLPLVVLDSMLPRQVLNITIHNGLLMELVRSRLQEETPSLGMIGKARLADGSSVTLTSGVEVEFVGTPRVSDKGLHLSLKGTRRFRVDESTVETTSSGWTEAKVEFLNSTLDDKAELSSVDPMSISRAMQTAREFTDPNFRLEGKSLVEAWLELARKRERKVGQIDQLLEDLGPMPSWKAPTECAMWVGALINPIPAMGVALEIRPQLLLAKTAEERTQIARDGIWDSILRMQGSD